jgi:hypothetical protein
MFTGNSFTSVTIQNAGVGGTRTYFVSNDNLRLSFDNAASLCAVCFGTNLADIPNGVAISGSPSNALVYLH